VPALALVVVVAMALSVSCALSFDAPRGWQRIDRAPVRDGVLVATIAIKQRRLDTLEVWHVGLRTIGTPFLH
jgi:hypothetical protein